MNALLCGAALALLASLSCAQAPRATNSLVFQGGAKVAVSYNHLEFGEGATLRALLSKDERGAGIRAFFNQRGFAERVAGKLSLSQPTVIAGTQLDAGSYRLGFRIDDDLIWYAVFSTEKGEEVFETVLHTQKDDDSTADCLVIQPLARDNAASKGVLQLHFGPLSAEMAFGVVSEEKKR